MAIPLISIVINNYNYGRFLKEALTSTLGQDFPRKDFEVLVIDDGSTDNSREILEQFQDCGVQAVLQKNKGQAAAISLGIAQSRGEIVCLLDSDDVWRPQKISSVAPLFDDPLIGGVQHQLEEVNASLDPLARGPFPFWPAFYSLDDFLEGRCEWTATSGMAFRKSALKRATPIPSEIFYCLDHFLAVGALLDFNIANTPRVLGSHRSHGDNWYFGAMADKKKLERESQNEAAFWAHIEIWLGARGKKITPAFERKKNLEKLRRDILCYALDHHFRQALVVWGEGLGRFWKYPEARFRLLTLLIAVFFPKLYFKLYAFYEKRGLSRLRKRVRPDK